MNEMWTTNPGVKPVRMPMYSDQPMQTTVQDVINFDGIGLHSGRFVRVSIHPAAANTGIQFMRVDVSESRQTIIAHPDNVEQASPVYPYRE